MRASFTQEIDSMLQTDSHESQQIDVSFEIQQMKFEELKIVDFEIYEAILEIASEEGLLQEADAADDTRGNSFCCVLVMMSSWENLKDNLSRKQGRFIMVMLVQ